MSSGNIVMLRLLVSLVAIACPLFPCFATEVCRAAAKAVEASLKAFVPPEPATFPRERVSIANANAQQWRVSKLLARR